ncbi:MAG: iron export ABC transporter permease subunit FetB [Denitrovibrio sp.]|nr:MAG: iron export ABC transporter permease subunit FetB [Denitrovibrio sp.]
MIGAGIAVATFFLFVLLISSRRGMKLEKQIGIAGARSIVQMFAMGFALEYIFKLESVWHVVYFAALMSVFAAYTASSRLSMDCRCLRRAFFAIYIPSMIGLIPVFLSGAVPVKMSAVLPVAGMALGNAMNAYTMSLDRLHAESKSRLSTIEGMLALGLTMKVAMKEAINTSVKAAMLPILNNIASLGVVLLPGLATGLLIAGVEPLKAVVYQLVIMYMIMSVNVCTSVIACYMFTGKVLMSAASEDKS